ncbi:MAG TPA: ABC transporter permease subunit [bacterium]|nr:ABC transporter permease subunit [bacterium]
MINIILRKFRDQWRSIIYYLIGLIGYAWMIIGLYPTMEKANFDEIIKNYPEEMLEFFGGEGAAASFSTIEGFLSLEFLSLFFILISIFYVASAAGSSIAGAIEKKTLDFQLAQPVSRTKLLLAETILGLIVTAGIVKVTTLAMWLLATAYDTEIKRDGLIAFALTATLLLWAFYGIALFLSSFIRSRLVVITATVFIMMGFYVFTSMTQIIDKLASYDRLSIFFLYKPDELLRSGNINENHLLVLAAITLTGIIGSLIVFNRRDI